ncbi:MAG: CRISPR-associated protein Cas5 [candidate division Zixibacteria bacterium]|nr:CRISPR-associated protein Cas5 [candidate division Zixibacteria bacterium]
MKARYPPPSTVIGTLDSCLPL